MRNCFVPGCDQQHKTSSKRAMFLAPKNQELLLKWIEVLPKVRSLRAHDKICHLHFRNEDVICNYEHTINGKIYQLERGRPRLRADAVPSINLPTCEQIKRLLSKRTQKKAMKKKQSLIDSSHTAHEVNSSKGCSFDVQVELAETENVDSNVEQNEFHAETAELINEPDEICHTFTYIYDNYYEVELPNTLWAVHRCPCRTAIFFSYINIKTMLSSKVISISANGLIKVLVENRLLYELTLQEDIQTMEMLATLIAQIDDEICVNYKNSFYSTCTAIP